MSSKQCLARRMDDLDELSYELGAWQAWKNASGKGVDWQFTTDEAKVHLHRLYPVI
jgi:hypothetical protein